MICGTPIGGRSLNFTFDEAPWTVWVHDRNGNVQFKANPGTFLQLRVPADGTYDAVITYPDVATRVFIEGIVVNKVANVAVSKADAIRSITIALLDIDGNLQPVQSGGERVEHKDSGVWQVFLFGFPTQRLFSNVSNAYSWEWVATQSTRSKETVYDFNGYANDGVTGDLTFQNQPSDLKHMTFRYTTPPGVDDLMVRHWSSDGPEGGIGFTSYYTNVENAIQAPFVREEYFMPIPYPDFSFGYFFEDAYPFDPATKEVLWDSQVFKTSLLAAQDTTTVQGFLPGEFDVPVLDTDSSHMPVALPPPHWFGSFDNTETTIRLGAARGSPVWLFLNQMQDMTPHPNLPFELYQGGNLVDSGDLASVGDPGGGSSSVSIPIAPGTNTLKVFYDKYFVDGAPGMATLSATFDSQAIDKDPPVLTSLNLLSGAEPVDSLPPTASGRVRVTFTEVLPVLPGLSYSTSDGTTWNPLAVTDMGSGDYSAALPNLPNGGNVSLRVQAQDTTGNSLDYQVVPAFTVAVTAPVLISPSNGSATNQLDITFQWEALETAVSYMVQIDTGDAFDSPSLIDTVVTGSQATVNLVAKGTYYWRVLAMDSQLNQSPWSVVWRLTIAESVAQVTPEPGSYSNPALLPTSGDDLMVFYTTCCWNIHVKTSDDAGASWSQPRLIVQNGGPPNAIQDRDGVIWLVYSRFEGSLNSDDVFYRTSTGDGQT